MIYSITPSIDYNTENENFYYYNSHTQTHTLIETDEEMNDQLMIMNFFDQTIPLENPTSEIHYDCRFDPLYNNIYFFHPINERIDLLIPTCEEPPIHTCREPNPYKYSNTEDIPFW